MQTLVPYTQMAEQQIRSQVMSHLQVCHTLQITVDWLPPRHSYRIYSVSSLYSDSYDYH